MTELVGFCQCGCGEPCLSNYKRGHHPNCRKHQTSNKVAWNKGLTKADHPSISKMGFQQGHIPFNDWSKVNERFKSDPEFREQWKQAKKGQVAWNKGLTREQYPNGIASGEDHGNWLGGDGGIRDTAVFAEFRRTILKRDHWTCRECGDHNHKGRGSRVVLHVHHIEPLCIAPDRILDPSNAVTLCFECHKRTETYGPKVKLYIKSQGGSP